MKAGHSNRIYFLTDALGTVRDIVDDTGAVVQSYGFDPHGVPMPGSGAGSLTSAKTYHGGLSVNDDMADARLYLMGHRFWEPTLGRFLSRDPIGFAGGLNLYGATFGTNPVTYADPLGLQPASSASSAGDWFNTIVKFTRWVEGKPIEWYYGLETQEVRDLMTAPKVEAARRYYARKNFDPCKDPVEVTAYNGKFRVAEFLETTFPFNSTKHFVGGFTVDIAPINNGAQVRITVRNTTSLPSLLYHIPGVPEIKAHRAPMSNQSQVYEWTENAPVL